MFLVVDIVNIGFGWWFIRPHILIVNVMKIKTHQFGAFFCYGTACTNRAENKQEFTDLMLRVKEFREK